ncbi:cytochrome c oxidase subunit 5b-1, mitochondrial-like [Diospyros lotus]|uniref:cytochrome c oxidase subunit 5b-1, mitochondrial-like n=1 Tax=Diospyros lotus TaxID=55363 RepID=UPI002254CB2F|nr:cytochrome c oxidase subunit 5b-1, mitochondrial-like [Diospyros lotus]
MWRRASTRLPTLASWRHFNRSPALSARSSTSAASSQHPTHFHQNPAVLSHRSLSDSGRKRVEDVMPIATGHEREEIVAELEGRNILEMNYPVGPFGTKEVPAIVKSVYDKRIVGCPGGEGEDEHDVVWFWLEKGKPHECAVCSQYFMLEVVGPGGTPDGHGDDDHH